MTNLDILKITDILNSMDIWPTSTCWKADTLLCQKGPSCQGYGFSSGHVLMWELDYKESWVLKNWCFWTVVLEKTLETIWTARRSNKSILKEISPECSLEGLMLKLKLQYFGHLMQRADSLEDSNLSPDAGKDWRQEEKGTTEDEMVGWHHQLNGHGFGWTPGVGDGQRGLVCCVSWGHKESDTTEQLNWTKVHPLLFIIINFIKRVNITARVFYNPKKFKLKIETTSQKHWI